MRLLWRLLRSHISLPQLMGFFLANLVGMLIVLLSLQFYLDLRPLLTGQDGFIKDDYLIVSKRIATSALIPSSSSAATFTEAELSDIASQPFTSNLGTFTTSQYRVSCSVGLEGMQAFGTQMYFEAVPDPFVDTDLDQWTYTPGDETLPIILPRGYLAIYNFGFAQSRSLPKLSEGVVTMATLMLTLRGEAGKELHLRGRVIGFTSRINTILVPESFMRWSNEELAPSSPAEPTRLIVQVSNPTDAEIATYMRTHGYNIDDDKLDAAKAMYLVRLVSALVMAVGLLISALSFFVLVLSIYLLVEKNTSKLENLLLIGYSPSRVCLPYWLLTFTASVSVLALALVGLVLVRSSYLRLVWAMSPSFSPGGLWQASLVGVGLTLVVCLLGCLAVGRKVMRIWRNKQ